MAAGCIVLTAPLTEIIDHAGYFIQMSMASLPMWLEGILNRKYPKWRERRIQRRRHGALHAGRRARARSRRCFAATPPTTSSAAIPDDLDKFIGPNTRVVAVSTHNPLGVTFAAGVYTSIFGSVEAADQLALRAPDVRARSRRTRAAPSFKVIVGGSGGWQITPDQRLGRARRRLRRRGAQRIGRDDRRCSTRRIAGEPLPRQVDVGASRVSATRSSSPTSARRSASSR